MGKGGKINLINGTPYDWLTTMPDKPYQMESWSFPAVIPSGKTTTVYIEWDDTVLSPADSAANVNFTLSGTPHRFTLQARATRGYTLQAYLSHITTINNAVGDTIPIGFAHNGRVNFALSGTPGSFTSSNVPVAWMQSSISVLGPRHLSEICMPGSHNAGMSKKTGGTAFATEDQCLCQSLSVYGQLMAGSRYFDIRPVVAAGRFATGHYSYVNKTISWQGMNGQTIAEIIADVNRFTAANQELVILNLSHDLDTDTNYTNFSPAQWAALLTQLSALTNLVPLPPATNLATLTLSSLISSRAAVLVLVPPGVSLMRGFHTSTQLNISDNYSNTADAATMVADQLRKMRARPKGAFFVLSWTLTQVGAKEVLFRPVRELAGVANPMLFSVLLGSCEKGVFPCVLYEDFLKADRGVAAVAAAVNSVWGP